MMPAHTTEGEISGANFLDALPIDLSAARLPWTTRNVPCAAVFIDRDMIHASRRRAIPKQVRRVPGLRCGTISGRQAVTRDHCHGGKQHWQTCSCQSIPGFCPC